MILPASFDNRFDLIGVEPHLTGNQAIFSHQYVPWMNHWINPLNTQPTEQSCLTKSAKYQAPLTHLKTSIRSKCKSLPEIFHEAACNFQGIAFKNYFLGQDFFNCQFSNFDNYDLRKKKRHVSFSKENIINTFDSSQPPSSKSRFSNRHRRARDYTQSAPLIPFHSNYNDYNRSDSFSLYFNMNNQFI